MFSFLFWCPCQNAPCDAFLMLFFFIFTFQSSHTSFHMILMNGYPKPACSLPPFPCSDLKLCHSEVTDDILRVDTKLTVPLCLTERLSQLLIIVVTLTVGSSVQGWCLQNRHVTVKSNYSGLQVQSPPSYLCCLFTARSNGKEMCLPFTCFVLNISKSSPLTADQAVWGYLLLLCGLQQNSEPAGAIETPAEFVHQAEVKWSHKLL